jgi:CheY-like chemotaxis protein
MASFGRKRILIVEDSPDLQSLLEQLLTGEGYTVESALNGQQALDHLNNSQTLPMFILLDIMMPVMDGLALQDKLLKNPKFANIPIVFMTADSHPEAKVHSGEFLKKPIEVDQLLALAARYASS